MGFPSLLMGENDVIVSKDLLDIFELTVGDKLLLKYEFLGYLPPQYDDI